MESTINAPVVAPIVAPALSQVPAAVRARATGAQRPAATAATRAASRPISVTTVWRDALTTLTTHPAAILLFAFLGFAAPVIVGNGLYTAAKLSEYARTQAVVTLYNRPSLSILLIQAGLGLLTLTFARGAITWLALYGKGCCEDGKALGSVGPACAGCRATFARFPMLLIGSLLYGAVITVGVVATSELTQGLEFVPNKMGHFWPGIHRAFGDMLRQLTWQGFNALMPNPGSPFAEFLPHASYLCDHMLRDLPQADAYHRLLVEAYSGTAVGIYVAPAQTSNAGETRHILAVLALFIVIVTETLFRFRTVAVIAGREGVAIAPLAHNIVIGVRGFRVITFHVWLVRLAIFTVTVALVEFPVAMLDHFLVPNVMRLTGVFEVLPIMRFVATVGAALVSAILLAFSVVYDARLYAALEHAQDTLNTRT